MDKGICVSVIVPVYNSKQYLRQCLDSIVEQTLKQIEIILVDDGSDDGSELICDEYAVKDSRIEVVHQSNMGLAGARQSGLNAANGTYVGFVDSDDWIEPDMFAKMYEKAREYSADIVFCNSFRNEDKKEKPFLPSGYYDRKAMEEVIFPRLVAAFDSNGSEFSIRWCNWLRIYKRSIITDNGISFDPRFRRCQDLPFTFQCTIKARSFYYLGDEYLYHNRMNYESLSKGYTKNMWFLLKPLCEQLVQISKEYPDYDFSKQAELRYLLFAFECADNEVKPNNVRSFGERIAAIRTLMNDNDVRRCLKKTDKKQMRRIYRLYCLCFSLKLPLLYYMIADKRYAGRKAEYRSLKAAGK